MSTAQRQKEKTGTWSQIFPNEQVSAQQSALFVKKLLAVAVSNITYLRAIFPEHAFGDRCLEDLNLKILKDDSSCSGACQVIQWVKGCFDALDKKYLRMLIIGIYADPDNVDTVIESYTFKFSYNGDAGVEIYRNKDKISSAHSAAETKKATIRLLRTIVVLTQGLHSLPDDVFMTMKLLYHDEITPADYEPPGFQKAATEAFNFDEEPMNIKVGDVITPFHTVKLRIKTDGKQFETNDPLSQPEFNVDQPINEQTTGLDNEDEPMEEITPVQLEPIPDQDIISSPAMSQVSTIKAEGMQVVPEPVVGDVPVTSPNQPGNGMKAISTTGSQVTSQQSQEDYTIKCGCGYDEDDGLMIMCAQCKYWQHAVCYRVLKEDEAPERHICDSCANPHDPELIPTDSHLHGLTPIAKEATCLWRRSLSVCQETSKIMVPNLAKRLGIEITVAHGLLSRLEKEGFVKPSKNKRHGKSVDKQQLEKGFKKYFSDIQEEEDSNITGSNLTEPKQFEEKMNNVNKEIDRIAARAEVITLEPLTNDKNKKKKDKSVQDQPTTQIESRKDKKRVTSTAGEIDQITSRAQTINLEGKRPPAKTQNSQKQQEKLGELQSNNPSQNDFRKGKKRVKSALRNDDEDFEICNSQDVSQETYPRGSSKRRKSSVARKSIRV